jgi:hypothetical protein
MKFDGQFSPINNEVFDRLDHLVQEIGHHHRVDVEISNFVKNCPLFGDFNACHQQHYPLC